MSYNLGKHNILNRASLETLTILKDISKREMLCPDSVSSTTSLDLGTLELDLADDDLIIVWASPSSDLSLYERFNRDSDELSA